MPDPDVRKMSEKKPSEMKTNKWAITYWLTEGRTKETLEQLVQSMPSNWAVEGQIEQGVDSQQKLHAQLFLKTEQTRGTKIQKYFPNCHISEAKNAFALSNYVHKEETRVDVFKTVENRSPQWSVVCQKFFDWVIQDPIKMRARDSTEHDQQCERLEIWDHFIGISIEEGMHVDLIGVNPQYRSAVRGYWISYVRRAVLNSQTFVDKKTDRQERTIPVVEGGVLNSLNI